VIEFHELNHATVAKKSIRFAFLGSTDLFWVMELAVEKGSLQGAKSKQ